MEFPRLILQRIRFRKDQPTGGLFFWQESTVKVTPLGLQCLELPWKANEPRVSCIPSGVYPMKWTFSPKFNRKTWELRNVKDRTAIRIHAGNYAGPHLTDSLGCILPCLKWDDINDDGVMDGTSSKRALALLEDRLKPYENAGVYIYVRNAPAQKLAK